MKVKVNAKLNLTLNVVGRQNGFHNIDSLATSVDAYDVVEVTKRADNAVTVSGMETVSLCDNSAYKAACGFLRAFNTCGVDITIGKRIPFGAGMGGSSADAAAVIYCMCKLFNGNLNGDKTKRLCAEIGSDVSFMLRGGLGRLRGKGEDLQFGKMGSSLYFALTAFDTSMSSAEVYSQFDNVGLALNCADNDEVLKLLQDGHINNAIGMFNNHLQAATASLSNYAYGYLQFCAKRGLAPNMTGSGSAYYVAFDNEAQAAAAAALLSDNGFNTVVCCSAPDGIGEIS